MAVSGLTQSEPESGLNTGEESVEVLRGSKEFGRALPLWQVEQSGHEW